MRLKQIIFAISMLSGILQPVLATNSANDILIAVRAHSGKPAAMKQWGPTIDYLNQALPSYRFVMTPYTSLKRQLADAKANRFHFLLTNPATYAELELTVGARALLTLINNRRGSAQTRFGSVIFTHVEHTDILSIQDLKHKDFVAVNPLGFGGWRVGLKILKDHGIDPETDFASLKFTGKQPAVVEAIRDKKAHAGIVRTDMLERMASKGQLDLRLVRILNQQSTPDFPFFHSSPLYPEWPFAVMPQTSKELAEQVKQALLKIERTDPAAKAGKYMGWSLALDYHPVKQLLGELGVAPFTDEKPDQLMAYLLLGLSTLLLILYAVRHYTNKRSRRK